MATELSFYLFSLLAKYGIVLIACARPIAPVSLSREPWCLALLGVSKQKVNCYVCKINKIYVTTQFCWKSSLLFYSFNKWITFLLSLWCKTKAILYQVLNKDALKSKILPHLSVAKSGYTLKDYREKVIHNILNMPENRLSMADYCYLCKK